MWAEFVEIFTGAYSWLTITLMCVGLVMCLIEAIVPGFGFFGIFGILCEVGAVVTNAVVSQKPIQVLILILLLALLTMLIFLLFVRSARYGILGKTPIVENKTTIPQDYGKKAEEDLRALIGKEGITLTECRPVGKVRIGTDIYEVSAKSNLIAKGDVVKVVDTNGSAIYVDKIQF